MEKTMKTYLALGFVAFLLTPATVMAGNDATLSSATAAQQQAKPVKGNVVDENGEPLIGVSVKIVGAYGGAITDINGDFSVNGAEGKQLQFSYAGYKTATSVLLCRLQDSDHYSGSWFDESINGT